MRLLRHSVLRMLWIERITNDFFFGGQDVRCGKRTVEKRKEKADVLPPTCLQEKRSQEGGSGGKS